MTEYWGGTMHFFLLTLYNFKNIGGGHVPSPPAPYSAVPCVVCNVTLDNQETPFRKTCYISYVFLNNSLFISFVCTFITSKRLVFIFHLFQCSVSTDLFRASGLQKTSNSLR